MRDRDSLRVVISCGLGVGLLLILVATFGCGAVPTGPDSGDPREAHILAETARFAAALRVSVRGVVTDQAYLVPAPKPLFTGEKVPAAGWYDDGIAYYYRPVVLRLTLESVSALAAHETCHALHRDEAGADRCAAELLAGSKGLLWWETAE